MISENEVDYLFSDDLGPIPEPKEELDNIIQEMQESRPGVTHRDILRTSMLLTITECVV